MSRQSAARFRAKARSPRHQPRVEVLEDRLAPAVITVTNTADVPGDPAPSVTTLRGAILTANLPDHANDTISFNIPGVGPRDFTIRLRAPLPPITHSVTIDGNNNGHGSVVLDGTNAGPEAVGLTIAGANCTIRNLTIDHFSAYGIFIWADGTRVRNNTISNNGIMGISISDASDTLVDRNEVFGNGFLATDAPISAPGSSGVGVAIGQFDATIQTDNNTVTNNSIHDNVMGVFVGGGASYNRIDGNTISSNTWQGVQIAGNIQSGRGRVTFGNVVSGNTIGSNGFDGVEIINFYDQNYPDWGVQGNRIEHNTIMDNGTDTSFRGNGVVIDGKNADNNSVVANTNISGNHGFGVVVRGGAKNNVIGDVTGGGNSIFSNRGAGVLVSNQGGIYWPGYAASVDPATGNAIRGNSIHDNGGPGIELNPAGQGPHAAGPNNLQNFPVLSESVNAAGINAVTGTLHTTPSGGRYTIDFYWGATPANAERYLGSTTVTTDSGGQARFTVTLPAQPAGFVTATATDSAGNTSQFSAPATVSTSTPTSRSGASGSVSVAPPTGGTLVGLQAVSPTAVAPTPPPPNTTLPIGVVEFSLIGLAPGASSTVTLTVDVPAGQTVTTYYKYGPEASNPSPHWYEFLFYDPRTGRPVDGQTGAEIRQISTTQWQVILHLVDGLRGDSE